MRTSTAILLVSCPDQIGLIHTITEFLSRHNGNIVQLNEHVERPDNIFFFRVEWELELFTIPKSELAKELEKALFSKYKMQWQLYFTDEKPRMAVFVSESSHCIYDIFSRYFSDEWFIIIFYPIRYKFYFFWGIHIFKILLVSIFYNVLRCRSVCIFRI